MATHRTPAHRITLATLAAAAALMIAVWRDDAASASSSGGFPRPTVVDPGALEPTAGSG